MKRFITLALVILMGLSVVACKDSEKSKIEKAQTGATATESALANAQKLLKIEKELTIGYLGGSITYGSSAAEKLDNSELNKEGNILNSWVNKTSAYFAEKFPGTQIETVNMGISNTQTNFGIYRLKEHIMNTDGHDMPDLVFLEFTSNDWIGGDDLKIEIESLIRNIYAANPYAEIVVLSTNVYPSVHSIALYREVAEAYGIPFINVGEKLVEAMLEKHGVNNEAETKFYTVDNLHPSAEGYKLYMENIISAIEPLLSVEIKDERLYNYYENLRQPINTSLIENPKITHAKHLSAQGDATLRNSALSSRCFGTDTKEEDVVIAPDFLEMNTGSTFKFDFTGNALGLIVGFTENPFTLRYKVDDGQWQEYMIDSHLYVHTQAKILEHTLGEGKHSVEFEALSDGIRIGAVLTDEK